MTPAETLIKQQAIASIEKQLKAPFPADVISVRQGSKSNGKAQLLFYVTALAVEDRLDNVFGIGNWDYYTKAVANTGEHAVVEGTLKICGIGPDGGCLFTKNVEAIGSAKGKNDIYMTAETTAEKRCAKKLGIGRYLYDMPNMYWPIDDYGFVDKDALNDFIAMVCRDLEEADGDLLKCPLDTWYGQIPSGRRSSNSNTSRPQTNPPTKPSGGGQPSGNRSSSKATEKQLAFIRKLLSQKFDPDDEEATAVYLNETLHIASLDPATWSFEDASAFISAAKELDDFDMYD